MQIEENKSLAALNTLGFPCRARYFARVAAVEEIQQAFAFSKQMDVPPLILGGGSNLVLTSDYPGLVIHNQLLGKTLLADTDDEILLRVGAGENWHGLVDYTLSQGWFGLENLALIPGSVGAAPIQNIGAYGVELCDVFYELEAFALESGERRVFSLEACEFGYRESVFKGRLKDQYLITSVTLRLSKAPNTRIDYSALAQALRGDAPEEISPQRVRDVVCEIRRSKLPDPAEIGNVGSFFKNPVVSIEQFGRIKAQYDDAVGFADGTDSVKLAAGWLIEKCGWKGHRVGAVGVHAAQALVLVNYESANPAACADAAADLLALARQIRRSVEEKFAVKLEHEPRIYPEPNW